MENNTTYYGSEKYIASEELISSVNVAASLNIIVSMIIFMRSRIAARKMPLPPLTSCVNLIIITG